MPNVRLSSLSISELAPLLEHKKISPLEVVDDVLERIQDFQSSIECLCLCAARNGSESGSTG